MYLKIVQNVNTSYGSLKEGRGVPQTYKDSADDSINIEVNEEESENEEITIQYTTTKNNQND